MPATAPSPKRSSSPAAIGTTQSRSTPSIIIFAVLNDKKVLADAQIGPADCHAPPRLAIIVVPRIDPMSRCSPAPGLRATTVSQVTTSVPTIEDGLSRWHILSPASPTSHGPILLHNHRLTQHGPWINTSRSFPPIFTLFT
jgi:hypothetical protein